MPLSEDRALVQITTQAKDYMKQIIRILQSKGLPVTGNYWLSNLILSQPLPCENGNGGQSLTDPCPEEEKG